jgi:hypothetical protein
MRIQSPTFQIFLKGCLFLGGSRSSLSVGEKYDVAFNDAVEIYYAESQAVRILYPEVSALRVNGPGAVTSGGGFIGGGFGVEGAVEGMAVAAVLNALTTRTKINTYLSLETASGELHFHYSLMEPGALRVALSPVFTLLTRFDPAWFAAQEEKLDWCKKLGFLDESTQAALRAALLRTPLAPQPSTGECPKCKTLVELEIPKCRKCGMTYDKGLPGWKPKPVF